MNSISDRIGDIEIPTGILVNNSISFWSNGFEPCSGEEGITIMGFSCDTFLSIGVGCRTSIVVSWPSRVRARDTKSSISRVTFHSLFVNSGCIALRWGLSCDRTVLCVDRVTFHGSKRIRTILGFHRRKDSSRRESR